MLCLSLSEAHTGKTERSSCSGTLFTGLRRWYNLRQVTPRLRALPQGALQPPSSPLLATAVEVEKALQYEAGEGCINLEVLVLHSA